MRMKIQEKKYQASRSVSLNQGMASKSDFSSEAQFYLEAAKNDPELAFNNYKYDLSSEAKFELQKMQRQDTKNKKFKIDKNGLVVKRKEDCNIF